MTKNDLTNRIKDIKVLRDQAKKFGNNQVKKYDRELEMLAKMLHSLLRINTKGLG